jgi:hypothetical protein
VAGSLGAGQHGATSDASRRKNMKPITEDEALELACPFKSFGHAAFQMETPQTITGSIKHMNGACGGAACMAWKVVIKRDSLAVCELIDRDDNRRAVKS